MAALTDPSAGAISFQILAEISVGATARIDLCRATDSRRTELVGQLLAVKRLHPHVADDPGFKNQFLDEVWMTSALRHPNVVEVKGWGTDDQGAYLAVELVQGVSLLRLMKTVFDTGEAFTERMVVFIASRLCRGLAAAHALRAPNGEMLNLVHRDLTPGNVLCGFNGDVKIADFGLAKAKQRLTKTLTGMPKGEPTYMAPEQARADDIDARADLFALGVILFELFAGRRPWLAKSDYEMVKITSTEPPADLRELRPKIDKELVSVVNKCLEKDPMVRFQSAGEIADRLENWLSVHGYMEGNEEALARFVRRNAMRQTRWFERAIAGELAPKPRIGRQLPSRAPAKPARGPPKKEERGPSLDEETDITDAEWRVKKSQQGRGAAIFSKDEEGEEVPTLVQKGDAALQAMRAARGPKPPLPRIADEDSDDRTTGVGRDPRSGSLTGDEIPTEPVRSPRPAAGSRARPPTAPPPPRAPQRNDPGRLGQIPQGPGLPQFSGLPPPPPPPPPSMGEMRPRLPPPPEPPNPSATPLPGKAYAGAYATLPEPSAARASVPDEVEVLDRRDFGPPKLTQETLIAEADRFAIEAVRRNEEARAAALRADRKAAVAKMAAEAAQVAAEAVRLLSTVGIGAAAQRLEQARQIEQAMMQRGQDGAPGGPSSFDGAASQVPVVQNRQSFFPPSSGALPLPPQAAMVIPPPGNTAYQPPPPSLPQRSDNIPLGTTFDPSMFRAQLKPGLLGLTPLTVAGLGIVAFCVVFLLIWLILG